MTTEKKNRFTPRVSLLWEKILSRIDEDTEIQIIASYFTIYAMVGFSTGFRRAKDVRIILTEDPVDLESIMQNDQFSRIRKICGDEKEYVLKNKLNLKKIAEKSHFFIKTQVKIRSCSKDARVTTTFIQLKKETNLYTIQLSNPEFNSTNMEFLEKDFLSIDTEIKDKENNRKFDNYFNQIWNNENLVNDIKKEILVQIERGFKDYSINDFFFFNLYNIFGKQIRKYEEEGVLKNRTGIKETGIWKMLYKFQVDGVLGAIDKIEKFNGCIIADSVGLGKTFEALAIIKYYELRNDRVLVLCPKKLRENWIVYTLNDKRNILCDDRFNFDVLNHTDLSRESGFSGNLDLETINWDNYDLVVIDESHNFRNNNPVRDRITRYGKLMRDVIQSGVKTKVLMLSATPVNNKINDLKNQVAFITEGQDEALESEGINSINMVMRLAQRQFNKWLEYSDKQKTANRLVNMLDGRYFKILDLLTIARSRKHIEKYYDIKNIGEFPERLTPINLKPDIDTERKFPSIMEINRRIWMLELSTYAPLKYIRIDKVDEYSMKYDLTVKQGSVFKQIDRENSLIYLMRVNLFKRLESSIHSFKKSLESQLEQVEIYLDKIQNKSEYYDDNLRINDIEIEDQQLEDFLIGNKVKVLFQDMDIIKWKNHLTSDKKRLEELIAITREIDHIRDFKLKELKRLIKEKVETPLNENNKKVLVFTAYTDTAEYLYKNISDWAKKELDLYSAIVTGSDANKSNYKQVKNEYNEILTSFSPKAKNRERKYGEMKGEIDILIATDCISEGQNLQDCDYVVNYDIHWNPVRIVQRFGRIDRLGSENKKIQLMNFWPNLELEEYINLEKRVTSRMVLLDVSATGEENLIISNKEMNDLEYRMDQLIKLQERVIDLEDIQHGITITDMSYNDFRMDLRDYLETGDNELKFIPNPMGMKICSKDNASGVIFCLKRVKGIDSDIISSNALEPFYLIYMNRDGESILNINDNKQILDLLQKMSIEKNEVKNYDNKSIVEVLNLAVQNIIGKYQESGSDSLFSPGGTVIKKTDIQNIEDFEVISFLEIDN
jgi:hypothetical protein